MLLPPPVVQFQQHPRQPPSSRPSSSPRHVSSRHCPRHRCSSSHGRHQLQGSCRNLLWEVWGVSGEGLPHLLCSQGNSTPKLPGDGGVGSGGKCPQPFYRKKNRAKWRLLLWHSQLWYDCFHGATSEAFTKQTEVIHLTCVFLSSNSWTGRFHIHCAYTVHLTERQSKSCVVGCHLAVQQCARLTYTSLLRFTSGFASGLSSQSVCQSLVLNGSFRVSRPQLQIAPSPFCHLPSADLPSRGPLFPQLFFSKKCLFPIPCAGSSVTTFPTAVHSLSLCPHVGGDDQTLAATWLLSRFAHFSAFWEVRFCSIDVFSSEGLNFWLGSLSFPHLFPTGRHEFLL